MAVREREHAMGEKVDLHVGEYHLTERIGSGGMGTVYLGRHTLMGRTHAVKVLSRELAASQGFLDRFRTEARVMASFDHPGIVKLHYAGQADGEYFLAMDYVAGPSGQPESLRDRLRTAPEGRLDEEQTSAWAIQIADALAYAHDHGVVHRDVKPGNILIDPENRVRLTDFGLAKAVGNDLLLSQIQNSISQSSASDRPRGSVAPEDSLDMQDTVRAQKRFQAGDSLDVRKTMSSGGADSRPPSSEASGILGTYDYMAPEQRREVQAEISARTDIYAFGVLLYRMLTGHRPVGLAKPPSRIVKGLLPHWDDMLERCLERLPQDRYSSAGELLTQLSDLADALARPRPSGNRQRKDTLLDEDQKQRERQILELNLDGHEDWGAMVYQECPFVPKAERRARIVSLFTLRGGRGKTTLTANLAATIALSSDVDRDILVVDTDFQGCLTHRCLTSEIAHHRSENPEFTSARLLEEGMSADDLTTMVAPMNGVPGVHVIAASDSPFRVVRRETGLFMFRPAEYEIRFRYRSVFHDPAVADRYDLIIFDCCPHISAFTVNALACSDFILMPIHPYPYNDEWEVVQRPLKWLAQMNHVIPGEVGFVGNEWSGEKKPLDLLADAESLGFQDAVFANYVPFCREISACAPGIVPSTKPEIRKLFQGVATELLEKL